MERGRAGPAGAVETVTLVRSEGSGRQPKKKKEKTKGLPNDVAITNHRYHGYVAPGTAAAAALAWPPPSWEKRAMMASILRALWRLA